MLPLDDLMGVEATINFNNNNNNDITEMLSDVVEHSNKRVKSNLEITDPSLDEKVIIPEKVPQRCSICKQFEDQIHLYNGHPNQSVEEFVALTSESLLLFNGNEQDIDTEDERPTNKITLFSIYDRKGHLAPLDTGLIEQDVYLYVSGYIKPIFDEDVSGENGIPAYDIGPINAWFISGYDGGEKAILSFSTAYGEYYMMEPSEAYEPIMRSLNIKIKLAKIIVEFLFNESWTNPAYEDLLQALNSYKEEGINEETLLRNAQFICDQIISIDQYSDDTDDAPLITTPCIRSLVKMAGVSFQKRKWKVKMDKKGLNKKQPKAPNWSKATTTTLVHDVMESFFTDQIANNNGDSKGPKKKRCGICEACQQPDCGECNFCRDMLKFGGSGRSKQACKLRRCPNMAIQAADDSDNEDEVDLNELITIDSIEIPCSKRIINKVQWVGEAKTNNGKMCYAEANVGGTTIGNGDYVVLYPAEPSHPLLVAEVVYMWNDSLKGPMFHGNLFIRGSDTVLGETADPREIFANDHCNDLPLGSILRRAIVERKTISPTWAMDGGIERLSQILEDDGQTFYFSKRYDAEHGRFEDLQQVEPTEEDELSSCAACATRLEKKKFATPSLKDGTVFYYGEEYRVGSGVYLSPGVFNFLKVKLEREAEEPKVYDDVLYPEYYRKTGDVSKASLADAPEPFNIGIIEEIIENDDKQKTIKIRVRKFYRPENTSPGVSKPELSDLDLLYYSDECELVEFNDVQGKCYITFGYNADMPHSNWCTLGPNRFYFFQKYDVITLKLGDVPTSAMHIGILGKGSSKQKNKSTKNVGKNVDKPPAHEKIAPLRCLDVFAGCGGLSEGLHQAGIAKTLWAIEKDTAAAKAFQMNNPEAKVYTDDCNKLLEDVMNESASTHDIPKKGDVQLLVGGPPCQGFSGMNRFNAGQYSLFKNSLIASYLSYCDYYRPQYFILENVRNFVSFKKSLVLKLTLRCLLAMGYQVTFGVLQAGHYGVPQTRRRLIILAAAPGMVLPKYPEPLHVFSKRGCQLSIQVGDHRYTNGIRWTCSAPYKTINVRDALGDLPPISNGSGVRVLSYECESTTHYQRNMRGSDQITTVTDHICKDMAPLVEARMSHIPLAPGSDWRDLPNIVIRLRDGNYSNKLRYTYMSKKQSKNDKPRGVCQCVKKGHCDPSDKQYNTLIPWCLPHTADRHNHWSGLYGRLEWNSYFNTTVTNPEPMGKQGRVLHPEQHRVVSVRECARSQGFPDCYEFAGNILDKHRQVGNAVPPPLGLALGRELVKAYTLSKRRNLEQHDKETH